MYMYMYVCVCIYIYIYIYTPVVRGVAPWSFGSSKVIGAITNNTNSY